MYYKECINFLLTLAQQVSFNDLKGRLQPLGVTPVQYSVLKSLWGGEVRTPKEIAEIVSLDASTMTGILDRMAKKGLLKRVASTQDRRKVLIEITPEGLAHRQEMEAAAEAMNQTLLKGFSEDEIRQFKDYLLRFHDNNTKNN